MLYVGIDLGTSAVKLLLMDGEGKIQKIVSREYPLYFPHPGWSEQHPEDWFTQSVEGIKELTSECDKSQVAGISFGGQMHGLVILDKDDQVIRLGDRFRIPYSPHRLLVDFMTHHFRLIRGDAFVAVGGITAINTLPPDYDLCLRLSERFEVGHLAKPLYRYRIRRDSISHGSRLSQVKGSFEAAKRALARRKLDTQYTLALGIRAKHVLRPKARPDPAA